MVPSVASTSSAVRMARSLRSCSRRSPAAANSRGALPAYRMPPRMASCAVARPRSKRSRPTLRRTTATVTAVPARPAVSAATATRSRGLLVMHAPLASAPPASPRGGSCPLRGTSAEHDPLPGFQDARLAEIHRVQHAECLPDLVAPRCGQRRGAVAVELAGPVWQRDHRRLPDVLPDLRDLLVQAGRIQQVRHGLLRSG